jgi:L-asparaginase
MKKVLIITTGGTIASEKTEHGLIPSLSSEQMLKYLPDLGRNYILDTKAVCNLDSTDMTPTEWMMIADAIKDSYDDYDGFVVLHGTDTMSYTAAALSYLVQNSPKPIVLTGAQKPIGSEITDAKMNMADSIMYAADPYSSGVVVVFGGLAIAGTRARKNRTYSFSAFSSINYPELAAIRDGKIIRYINHKIIGEPVFTGSLDPNVFHLKLSPGMSPQILEPIIKSHDAIIIESFGVGGMPKSLIDDFINLMSEYEDNEKIVVLTTQVTYEGSNIDVYEVGQRIKEHVPVLEAKDMTHEAVLTKLMWILGMDPRPSFEKISEIFYKEINYDTIL